ncbi:alkyl hydroperoxide reductase [Solitalea longa]|uniref:Alkyl hydroperoxide reductase n=1 Tax=Solitalea longa TaxID=2079460 RepID=A0A2S5A8Q2_9SPHI|nr:TlpA disulfide reductase family protein [Solitalea longa]POY38971.1 alkyl hydroperoxide reductase [Solitalea longa]
MRKLKSLIWLLCLIPVFASAQTQNSVLTISGTVAGNAKVIYLQNYRLRTFHVLDSAKVIDGKFQFSRKLQYPEVYGLAVDTAALAAVTGQQHPDAETLPIFFDDDKSVKVEFDADNHFQNSQVIGSAATEIYQQFRGNRSSGLEEFIKKNAKSIVPAYVLYRNYSSFLQPKELEKYLSLLDPSLAETQYVKDLEKLVGIAPIGSKAIDFSLPDINGKPVKLSDKLGKNYVLLEFWAGWCPVCRFENPNLVKNYQKYKDKGFDVFGVSLDKNKESWLKAIKDFGLDWTQVSDLSLWDNSAAQLYGFRALPASILIDPQGTIIAKNLIGEALDKKLAELLSTSK